MKKPLSRIALALLFAGVPSLLVAQSPAVQQLYQQAHADQEAGREEQAIARYRELLRLDPSVGPAYNNLGRIYYNLGRYPETIATLKQGLVVQPEMAPAQVMLGAAYFQMGMLAEALPLLEDGVRAMPADHFARITLARVLIGLGRPAEAIEQLQAVLAATPKDQEAWYVLGKLHLQLSEEAFRQVQAINPDTALAHELEGELMESMQNTQGAIDAYKQAIAAAPADTHAIENLANLYWSTGDWAHAREEYGVLLTRQPANCIAHWKLANSLDELAEPPDTSLAEVGRALELCPALPQAHAERGRLLLQTGKPAEALADLQIAEKAAPDEPSVQHLMAEAYRKLGQAQQAAAADQRFRDLEAAERAGKQRHAARVNQSNQ